MKNKQKEISISVIIGTIFSIVVISLYIINIFNAEDNAKKQELFDIFLTASVNDIDGNKLFLKDNEKIEIKDQNGNDISYMIDNGNIKAQIPLYEYDSEYSGEFEKDIVIDNNKHNTVITESSTYINTYDASSLLLATKNSKELKVSLDNYYISLPSTYNGDILSWSLSKELEQTYESENYKMTLNVTTDDNYKEKDIEQYNGGTSLKSYILPANYRDINIIENTEGSYLRFDLDDNIIKSIADGTVVEANNIKNYIIIKYNDGLVMKYDNVYIQKYDSSVKKDEILGIAINEYFDLYTWSDGELIAAEWLYDGYERPSEGPNLPRMYQTDPEWADISYGYNTIGGGGCGPTSFAMTVSGLTGKVYTPADIVEVIKSRRSGIWYYQKGIGSCYSIFPALCDYFDLQIDDSLSTSESTIKESLNEGKIVIVSLTKGKIYTGEGHFIVIRGLTDDGKFLINDSARYFDLNTGYDYSDLKPITSARAIYK